MVELERAEQLAFNGVVAAISERDVLRVSGADAASYLHGQISQAVEGLAVGATAWTLLLQPQGKVDAWFRMHRRGPEEFWLDVEPGFGQPAKERLERFKLRVDAEIDLIATPIVALRGPGAAAAAADAGLGEGARPSVVLDASWGGVDGVDLLAPECFSGDGVSAVAELVPPGIEQGPPELLEVLRVRQGRPAMGHELDDSTIPAAAGVVDASVDFTKGCYVGQELVARVDSRGNNTPTRLYGLRFTGTETPAVGAELQLAGAVSGTVTSVAKSPSLGPIGLAYLKRAVEVPASLEVALPDGQMVTAQAAELPIRDS